MKRLHHYAVWLLALLTLTAALAVFALSLNHPINADLAMLHYSAWLINERDFVVYRDIFELNFPGPFLFHSLLGQLVGYEPLPLRFVDLALLLLLAAASWKIIAPLSRPAAVFGFSLFVLLNLIKGGEYVLERDFLGLVPAALAFAIACSNTPLTRGQVISAALLAALACSMKPNAVVLVPVLVWIFCQRSAPTTKYRTLLWFFASMVAMAVVPFLWVLQQGGLPAFIDIYRNFVPVYANSRYDLWHYNSVAERLQFLLDNYLKAGGGAMLLSAPGLAWVWVIHRHNATARQRITRLAAMMVAFTFYEVIAGKFWLNHMFPSAYWICLCFALLLTPTAITSHRQTLIAMLLLLPAGWLAWTMSSMSWSDMHAAWQQEAQAPQQWRARRVADFLHTQALQENDRVQVLDMAGDGQASLLLARATSATRHLIDVPLYMQPDTAATQALRQELLTTLNANPPRFIIFFDEFLHPGGGNRLREFRELAAILDQQYELAERADGEYSIFRRK